MTYGGSNMFYIVFILGASLFIYGYIKNKKEKNDFETYYQQASDNKKEYKLVNHTLEEEAMKDEINDLQKEIEKLKSSTQAKRAADYDIRKNKTEEKHNEPISYKELIQKLQGLENEQAIDKLSKEMEIGKGELQLLINLFQK